MNQHMPSPAPDPAEESAPQAIARLRSVLALVEEMAGGAPRGRVVIDDSALDEISALTLSNAIASSVTRRRFDALARETAAFAAAGLAALMHHRERGGSDCAPAAARLAAEMRRSISAMAAMLRAAPRRY